MPNRTGYARRRPEEVELPVLVRRRLGAPHLEVIVRRTHPDTRLANAASCAAEPQLVRLQALPGVRTPWSSCLIAAASLVYREPRSRSQKNDLDWYLSNMGLLQRHLGSLIGESPSDRASRSATVVR
jgi:hypothetical protein